jgi:hypothetical protein
LSEALATVRIKHGDGFAVINKSDFDPATQQYFVPAPTAPVAPPPGAPAVPVAPPHVAAPVTPAPAPAAPVTPAPAAQATPADALAKLPADWREVTPTHDLRELASRIAGRMPDDRAQAIEMLAKAGAK